MLLARLYRSSRRVHSGLDAQLLEQREGDGAVRAELAVGQRRVEGLVGPDSVPVLDDPADKLLACGRMVAQAAERLGDGVGRVDGVEDRAQREALRMFSAVPMAPRRTDSSPRSRRSHSLKTAIAETGRGSDGC